MNYFGESRSNHPSDYGLNVELMKAGQRRCSDCRRTLPLDEFCRAPSQHSGYSGRCHACHRRAAYHYNTGGLDVQVGHAIREDNQRRTDGRRRCIDCGTEGDVSDFRRNSYVFHKCNSCAGYAPHARRAEQKRLRSVGLRRCSGCAEVKSLDDFYRCRDGWQSECKPCFNASCERRRTGREVAA